MLCKHPEETAAALRRVREEAECVKLGGQSKIDSGVSSKATIHV